MLLWHFHGANWWRIAPPSVCSVIPRQESLGLRGKVVEQSIKQHSCHDRTTALMTQNSFGHLCSIKPVNIRAWTGMCAWAPSPNRWAFDKSCLLAEGEFVFFTSLPLGLLKSNLMKKNQSWVSQIWGMTWGLKWEKLKTECIQNAFYKIFKE